MKGITFENMDGSNLKIGIVVAQWNSELTNSLLESCIEGLKDSSVAEENIIISHVPGSFEVVHGAKKMIDRGVDAVVAIGVLIKGETMHFEYLAEAASQGLMKLNIETNTPVIFGVLTALTEDQARKRSIGEHNHGFSWGKSAVQMGLLT